MKAGSRKALLLALALDCWGEPPTRLHPVVWIGNYLNWARRRWQGQSALSQWQEGTLNWGVGAGCSFGLGLAADRLPWWIQGGILKTFMARRALFSAVREVEQALQRDDLAEARRLLAWHLVSRDTSALTASEVTGAAIESLAENLSDSVVAPLLAYRMGGLGLAAAYRFTNTADAMWGYRTPTFEWSGKTAAKMDDLLNIAPARLTALCTLLVSNKQGWKVWIRDKRATSSPNAGHPMSAFAGALGIRLDKRGVYVLHADGREPTPRDMARARKLADRVVMLAVFVMMWKSKGRL